MWEIIIALIIVSILIIAAWQILKPMLVGAPFVRTNKQARDRMFEAAQIKKGERVVDLGSGDGTLVIAAAAYGGKIIGYEINRLLVWQSRRRIRKLGLTNAVIYRQSFWKADVSDTDVVLLFGITHIMSRLEKKLLHELPSGARVVSHVFTFPHWETVFSEDGIHVYVKK